MAKVCSAGRLGAFERESRNRTYVRPMADVSAEGSREKKLN